MRSASCLRVSLPLLFVAACGGSTSSVPSDPTGSGSGSGSGAGTSAQPGDAPPPSTPPPVATTPGPCGTMGVARSFASAKEQADAIGAAWQACSAHMLCPVSEPYLLVVRGTTSAACGQWCSGDGGHCATHDPAYLFTWSVTQSASSEYVLELTSASGDRRFTIAWWDEQAGPAMQLTDVASGDVTALEAVGVPVK